MEHMRGRIGMIVGDSVVGTDDTNQKFGEQNVEENHVGKKVEHSDPSHSTLGAVHNAMPVRTHKQLEVHEHTLHQLVTGRAHTLVGVVQDAKLAAEEEDAVPREQKDHHDDKTKHVEHHRHSQGKTPHNSECGLVDAKHAETGESNGETKPVGVRALDPSIDEKDTTGSQRGKDLQVDVEAVTGLLEDSIFGEIVPVPVADRMDDLDAKDDLQVE